MKNNLGFSSVLVILAVVLVAGVGGLIYFQTSNVEDKNIKYVVNGYDRVQCLNVEHNKASIQKTISIEFKSDDGSLYVPSGLYGGMGISEDCYSELYIREDEFIDRRSGLIHIATNRADAEFTIFDLYRIALDPAIVPQNLQRGITLPSPEKFIYPESKKFVNHESNDQFSDLSITINDIEYDSDPLEIILEDKQEIVFTYTVSKDFLRSQGIEI